MKELPASNATTVVIAGMGIAGLTAAVELAKKNCSLVILEPRKSFSRGMVVKITQSTYNYLMSLRDKDDPKDEKFFVRIKGEQGGETGAVQVKDIQKFLLRKLEKLSEREGHSKAEITILRGEKYKISEIDPTNQTVTVLVTEHDETSQIKTHFNHFVAADGARHEVVDILNESIAKEEEKIRYQRQAYQPRQALAGTISMQLKEGVAIKEPKGQFTPKHFPALKALGWNKAYFPKTYAFLQEPTEGKRNKYFVVGEIPEAIERMQDKQKQRIALQAWGRLIMLVKCGYNYRDLDIIEKQVKEEKKDDPLQADLISEKNKLQATTFRLELSHATQSSYKMGEGGAFAIVGDSFKGANPFLMHGANDAILDGIEFARHLKTSTSAEFDFKGFNFHQRSQLAKVQNAMKSNAKEKSPSLLVLMLNSDLHRVKMFANRFNTNEKIQECLKAIDKLEPLNSEHPDQKLYANYYSHIHLLLKEIKKHLQELDKISKANKGEKPGATFASQQKYIKAQKAELKLLKQQVYSQLREYSTSTVKTKKSKALLSHPRNETLFHDVMNKIREGKFNEQDDQHRTILMRAIMMNVDKSILAERLSDKTINVNLEDKNGNTALAYAAAQGNLGWIQLLLTLGAKVDDQCLNQAKKHPEIYKLLEKVNEKRKDSPLLGVHTDSSKKGNEKPESAEKTIKVQPKRQL